MNQIKFDPSGAINYIQDQFFENAKEKALTAKRDLLDRTGIGNNCLGWIDLPVIYDQKEFVRIQQTAEKIQTESEVLVVIGIGGSYLGAKAAIDFLLPHFYNQLSREQRGGVEIYFAGHHLSGQYLNDLMSVIGKRDFSVNVISKSGTTTEPAIAFRFFKHQLEKRYGKEGAAKRIYATTDKTRGALKKQADNLGYETFSVPEDVGGRYSVLTAVGLLPIAAAGIDVEEIMRGASDMRDIAMNKDFEENPMLQYAAYRNLFFNSGKTMELLANGSPSLHMFGEWWKQLFGESEGKNHKGLFPAVYDLTTDLHSLGQFVQDGNPILFETIIDLQEFPSSVSIDPSESNLDGLNYLVGKDMDHIHRCAVDGAFTAHVFGGTPVLKISIPAVTPRYLGQLFYFFEFACGVSGYMLGVNPFDQPGVEAYKHNMFKLLGKPGF